MGGAYLLSEEKAEGAQVKIRIPLRGSASSSGYESESVWAEPLGDGRYKVWNVPAFAYNVDMTDVVACTEVRGELPVMLRVVERGTCFGVRLYFSETATDGVIAEVLETVSARRPVVAKCSKRLWTVGFRSAGDHDWLGSALRDQLQAGLLELDSVYQDDEPSW